MSVGSQIYKNQLRQDAVLKECETYGYDSWQCKGSQNHFNAQLQSQALTNSISSLFFIIFSIGVFIFILFKVLGWLAKSLNHP